VSALHLHLTRETFDQIATGQKIVEYRKQSPHWQSRLEGKTYDVIKFRNGYAKDAPEIIVEFVGLRRVRRNNEPYYAIELGKVLRKTRWRKPACG